MEQPLSSGLSALGSDSAIEEEGGGGDVGLCMEAEVRPSVYRVRLNPARRVLGFHVKNRVRNTDLLRRRVRALHACA